MKAVTNISLTLENMETIKLTNEEISSFAVENISDQITQIGPGVFQFQSFEFLRMELKTCANHTYNAFGSPSSQTIFQRLTSEDTPIGCIELEYSDGSQTQLYVPDDMAQIFETDTYGNLVVTLGYTEDADDGCCCCGDCED